MRRYFRPIVLGLALAGFVALLAACGGSSPAAPSGGTGAGGPRIAVDEESFDFGKVPLDKVVSHTFRIKNVGGAPLVLNGEPPVRAVQGC